MGATASLCSALAQEGLPFSVGLQETTKKNRNQEDEEHAGRRRRPWGLRPHPAGWFRSERPGNAQNEGSVGQGLTKPTGIPPQGGPCSRL